MGIQLHADFKRQKVTHLTMIVTQLQVVTLLVPWLHCYRLPSCRPQLPSYIQLHTQLQTVTQLQALVTQQQIVTQLQALVTQQQTVIQLQALVTQQQTVTQLQALVTQLQTVTQLQALVTQLQTVTQLQALVTQLQTVTQLQALVTQLQALATQQQTVTQLQALVEDIPVEGEGGLPAAGSVVLLGEVVVAGPLHPVLTQQPCFSPTFYLLPAIPLGHRRRINTEEKAKVVAAG